MEFDPTQTWVVSPRLAASEIGDESVVLNLADGKYYGLNDMANRVWRELQQPRSIDQIAAALTAEYEVAEDQARRDVAQLLAELHTLQLIVSAP